LLQSRNFMKRKKPLRGSQTQEIHYPKTKLVTRHSYSHNLCSSHTFNSDTKLIVNAFQPDLPPEEVFDGFFYFRVDP
jgi:hypothetical protein